MNKGFLFLLIFVCALGSTIVYAQSDPSGQEDMEISQAVKNIMPFVSEKMLKARMQFLTTSLTYNKVPQDTINEVTGKIGQKEIEQLAIAAFKKYFTADDAKRINEFYGSPTGKKFAENMPALTGEFFKQADDFYKKAYGEIFDELEKKGYKLDDLRKTFLNSSRVPGNIPNFLAPAAADKK